MIPYPESSSSVFARNPDFCRDDEAISEKEIATLTLLARDD